MFTKKNNRPFLIAGPCSAETEEQVIATAQGLKDQGIDLFRSGVWQRPAGSALAAPGETGNRPENDHRSG
jgi:3-deoxy-D-arabino-heptulosonate 7-phosphate (DAHP) synthase